MIGKTREAYRQDLRPSAEERLRKRLVLNEIAHREELEADPEAVEEQIEQMVVMAGSSGEQMREMLESPEGRLSLSEDLIIEQAQELATQIGKGEAPSLEEEEADAEAGAEPEDEEQAADDAPTAEAGEPEAGEDPEEGKAE
jgi:trigger factor